MLNKHQFARMLFTINKLNKFYLQSTKNKLIELEVQRNRYISKKWYFYLTMYRKSGIIIVVRNNAYSAWMNQRTSALSIDYNTPISPRTYSTKRARRHASFAFEYFSTQFIHWCFSRGRLMRVACRGQLPSLNHEHSRRISSKSCYNSGY